DAAEPDRAHVWRAALLDGTFNAPALVIGMAVHMMMAMLFGTLIAAAAYRLPAARSLVIAGGMLFTAGLWAVMQYGIWRAIPGRRAQRCVTVSRVPPLSRTHSIRMSTLASSSRFITGQRASVSSITAASASNGSVVATTARTRTVWKCGRTD